MDLYTACSIVEGFSGEESTEAELNEAWQWLIDTGHCWKLQGWYGRSAMDLIESGLCKPPEKDQTDYWGNKIPGVPRK